MPLSAAYANSGSDSALVAIDNNTAPVTELTTLDGHTLSLGKHLGQVTVVHFWATWCAPCIEELPALASIQQEYAGQSFNVLAIAADSHAAVNKFRQTQDVELTMLVDQYGGAMRDYRVNVLPTTYLVDKQGRLRYRARGKVAWQDCAARHIIAQLLAE